MKEQKPTAKDATPGKKPGRKTTKQRINISLSPNLNKAATVLGERTFGHKTTYIEHLILKDLERQGYTVEDIDRLAEEWEEKKKAGHK